MTDILPCPFCGTTDDLQPSSSDVACYKCGANGPVCDSMEEAIDEWNRVAALVQKETT